MEKLNEYLQQLINQSGLELHLEPNKSPYVVTTSGTSNVSTAPLPGTQINTMIFSLIPMNVKQQLPNSSEVEFIHPHNLGDFKFVVRKSPAGFNVTITPTETFREVSDLFITEEDVDLNSNAPLNSSYVDPLHSAPTSQKDESELLIELNSPPQEKGDFMHEASIADEVLTTSDYEFEFITDDSVEENQSDNMYSQIEIESSFSNQANFPIEQNFNAQPMVETTNDFSSQLEISENPYQDFLPQPSNSYQVETASAVENVPVQNQTIPQVAEQNINQTIPQVVEQNINQMQTTQYQQPMAQPVIQTPTAPTVPATASMPVFQPNPQAQAKMDSFFYKMAEIGASDLHLSVSMPPMVRKDGKIAKLEENEAALTPASMQELLNSIMPQKNLEEFAERNDTDFAYEIKGLARFRANIFMDRKGMGGVFRIIPSKILTSEDLGLSKHILDLCDLSKGLVVVTGPTGSGKSTTLCAMVDHINRNREDHLITIEDPIEFTHENKMCLVNQREVHNHTDSFKDALRAALREDPDILLVGEMRDLETISIAIETAETGHLVFGTLHTTTAASTVDRIIDQFPADRQQQIRVMLSESLRGVIAQTLLPKKGGGRIAALEVLIVTPAVSNLIREGKTFQIPSAMQTGKNKGMVMLNDSLMDLVNKGLVEPRDAYIKAVDKEGFEMLLNRNNKRM